MRTSPSGVEGDVLGGHRRAEDVLEQGFAGTRVVGTGPGGGVEPEAGVLGAQGAEDHRTAAPVSTDQRNRSCE